MHACSLLIGILAHLERIVPDGAQEPAGLDELQKEASERREKEEDDHAARQAERVAGADDARPAGARWHVDQVFADQGQAAESVDRTPQC